MLSRLLGLPQGDCYQRLYSALPWWLGATLLFALLVLAARPFVENRTAALAAAGAQRLRSWRDLAGLVLLCTGLVAAFDGAGFVHGFFRQDDFSFLQVVRETDGLARQMVLYHNDHSYPLFRLEVWGLVQLAGPQADTAALARWFNATSFVACVALLLAACWVLHELGSPRLTLLAAAFALWCWPGWGEFTAGYYTLGAYVQVQALAFGTVAAILRAFRRDAPIWFAGSLLCLLTAAGLNISGLAALAMAGLTGAACLCTNGRRRLMRPLLATLALATLACAAYLVLTRHAYSARELVQNPTGQPLQLLPLGDFAFNPAVFAAALASAPGGLLLAFPLPTFLHYATGKIAAHTPLFSSIIAAQFVATAVAAVFFGRRFRRLSAQDRTMVLLLGANAAIALAMVFVARLHYAVSTPLSFWHAKYLLMPLCWSATAALLLSDRLGQTAPDRQSPRTLCAVLAVGIWFTVSCWHWERTLFPQPMGYVARGRWGNVENARARAQQYAAVMADLAAIARFGGSTAVTLPEPTAWSSEFYRRFGLLEWGADTGRFGVTHLFWDMPAASPRLRLHGRFVPTAAITPPLSAHLRCYPWLQPAFADVSPLDRIANK